MAPWSLLLLTWLHMSKAETLKNIMKASINVTQDGILFRAMIHIDDTSIPQLLRNSHCKEKGSCR